MPKLKMVQFKCVEDTNEIGFESPYFLTFVGDLVAQRVRVKLTRKSFWNNKVDKGETWPVNDTITNDFDLAPAHTIVLAAMVEKDDGIDIVAGEVSTIEATMKPVFLNHVQAGFTASDPNFVSTMSNTFQQAIATALATAAGADDDLMIKDSGHAIRKVPITSSNGHFGNLTFPGGGGLYSVTYGRE